MPCTFPHPPIRHGEEKCPMCAVMAERDRYRDALFAIYDEESDAVEQGAVKEAPRA